jgi:hypothetical protein
MIELEALELRFREGDDDAAPDVAAFVRVPRPRRDVTDPIAVIGGGTSPRDAPLLVFFQHASFAIPRPQLLAPPLDVSSWRLRATMFGHLAAVEPATRRGPQRTAWVLGAFLPIAFATQGAAASEPTSVQRPTRKSVTKPELPPAPDEAPASAEPIEATDPPANEPITDPFIETPVTDSPPPPPPAARSDPQALVDAAWEGVDGFDVDISLAGGGRMTGRVGAVQKDTFTLIQSGTGAVLVLAKNSVRSLRVQLPKPLPARNGVGALVTGGILTGVGAPVFISGLAFVAVCPTCPSLHLPLLIIGGATLAAGIPLLVRGSKLRRKYREAFEERAASPVVMRTPYGWSGGVRFRF